MCKQLTNQKLLLLFGVCVAIPTTACTTGVETRTQKPDGAGEGVSYFLPRNDVRVVFTNDIITSEVLNATKVLDMAKKDEKIAKTELAALNAQKPATTDEVKKHDEAVAKANKTITEIAKKVSAAEADLEKKKASREQILIEVLPPVPDTSQLYVAALKHSLFNDDTVTFKTSPEGLLTQVTYRGADRTGDVIQNLVEAGIEAAKIYARLHGLPIPPTAKEFGLMGEGACTPQEMLGKENAILEEAEKKLKEAEANKSDLDEIKNAKEVVEQAKKAVADKKYYYEFTIDPSKPEKVAGVNIKLLNTPLPFLVNLRAPTSTFKAPGSIPDLDSEHGLLYRRAIPYTVEILEDRKQKEEICQATKEWIKGGPPDEDPPFTKQITNIQKSLANKESSIPTSRSQQVMMVAGGPITTLVFTDRPFVTTDLSATFKQGVLLDSSETRPSEVLGFSMIPLKALRAVGDAVGSIITNIFQFKIDYTNKTKELINAETDLEKAKQANAELQKKVLDQFESGDQPAPEVP